MKKYVNGQYIELTLEELAAMQDAAAQAEAEEKRRPMSISEVQEMLVRQQINTLTVDDQTAMRMVEFYPEWETDTAYTAGHKVQHNGKLYKCLQAHTAQADWNPVDAPSLWAEVLAGQDGTAIGEWVQSDSTNPYMRGDKVKYKGKLYESEVDNNVWEPGVYGWVEI